MGWIFYKLFDTGEFGSSQILQNLLISDDLEQSEMWEGFEESGLNPTNPESNNIFILRLKWFHAQKINKH